ncbi:glycosylhydrolase-like jelly roll fold domain-containing protein [Epilithonimonas sp.]|uniref:glycosylhydrolase-like jelly roll fold domain-containing protein n=1 Tax=Epilithonimonas sp. TaxID=2894511 RepID=UPI0028A16846|nr:glycosylhydrolase-like jelly roll fold domain-containing protein [Epilithonimonas sp.]
MKYGESLIIKASETPDNSISKWNYIEKIEALIVLNQPWQLAFKEGEPEIPKSKTLEKLQPWTNFTEDASTQSFSGTGVYTTSFKLKKKADDFVLKFDKLYESAKVIINGQDAGIVWSLPYEINDGKYLKKYH